MLLKKSVTSGNDADVMSEFSPGNKRLIKPNVSITFYLCSLVFTQIRTVRIRHRTRQRKV